MVVPDVLEQHGAGDDLAGVLHEIFEQAEFARLQHDLLAAARRQQYVALHVLPSEPSYVLLHQFIQVLEVHVINFLLHFYQNL